MSDAEAVAPPVSEQKARMLAGELYRADDTELRSDAERCHRLLERYNATSVDELAERAGILRELLGSVGEGVVIRPPLVMDYGYQTTIGARTFINAGAVILDVGRVTIGEDVQIGPNVQLLTPTHERRRPSRSRSGTTPGSVAA
jgi:maltose O-acetyltransferase